jgi:hypothetical protein
VAEFRLAPNPSAARWARPPRALAFLALGILAARFITGVAQTADQVAAASDATDVRLNALRWKIAAVPFACRHPLYLLMPGLCVPWPL